MRTLQRLKVALDELRTLMIGAQILFGFQLRAAFERRADTFDATERGLLIASTLFMSLALGILISAPSYHRIVAKGAADNRMLRLVTGVAACALPPFALSLGSAFTLVTRRSLGPATSWSLGSGMIIMAIGLWYVAAIGIRMKTESGMAEVRTEPVPLLTRIDQMLTEARVILPGAQAVFGFQLIAMLTDPFDHLPALLQWVHTASMLAVGLAIILLMAPSALHRLGYGGDAKAGMLQLGSTLVTVALLPLGLGIAGDVFVAVGKVARSLEGGAVAGAGILIVLLVLWFGWPLAVRGKRR